jgi:hypothetical protein
VVMERPGISSAEAAVLVSVKWIQQSKFVPVLDGNQIF